MNTPEYQTLSQYYPSLITFAQQKPKEIADNLKPHGILAQSEIQFLKNTAHDNDAKARVVMDAVLTQVQQAPQVYHIFIEVLEALGPSPAKTYLLDGLKTSFASFHTSGSAASHPQPPTVVSSEDLYVILDKHIMHESSKVIFRYCIRP